ncbi:unnamed protein product [Fraxinus pennsylvanica]|uniref:non-specific serine/threonine protein kinase n=1 Tax=Fraxinus pennsylvanica TaxID=56036 RepID=A0AAD2DN98_9LAMI|nr:unnamed protein product [Fraxinus pennsylvanica]
MFPNSHDTKMKSQFLSTKPLPICFCTVLFLFHLITPLSGDENEQYKSCGNLFNCGKITGIHYPFWGNNRPRECGYPGLKLECENDTTIIETETLKYRVLDINQDTQVLRITRMDISTDICGAKFVNTILDSELFEYASAYMNLTFHYGCPPPIFPFPNQFDCPVKGTTNRNGYVEMGTLLSESMCHASLVVPTSYNSFGNLKGLPNLLDLVREGFEVRCKVDISACRSCENSGGRCGYDLASNQFICLCQNQPPGSAVCKGSPFLTGNTTQPSPAGMGSSESSRSGAFVLQLHIISSQFYVGLNNVRTN